MVFGSVIVSTMNRPAGSALNTVGMSAPYRIVVMSSIPEGYCLTNPPTEPKAAAVRELPAELMRDEAAGSGGLAWLLTKSGAGKSGPGPTEAPGDHEIEAWSVSDLGRFLEGELPDQP
jgi:hypothetical protein